MRLYYPNSFLKLTLTGFLLVALPLIASFIHASISADRLALQSQKAVRQAVLATQFSWMLVEQTTSMERNARQFVVLEDRALFEGYTKVHEQFLETVATLAELKLDNPQRRQLSDLAERELRLFDALSAAPQGAVTRMTTMEGFFALTTLAQSILNGSSRLIEREVDTMQSMAADAQQTRLWQALALVPIVLLLAGAFTFLIARPIRQIDAAIRALGSGDMVSSITVRGPQDLENLGKRLEWLRLRLMALETQRTKLLQHISHELKTPLTALREGAELLADQVPGSLNAQQMEIAGILRQSAFQLQRRIEDLLNFSEAHLRHAALHIAPVALRDTLEKAAQNHKLALMSKGLKLVLEAPTITLPCDEEKLLIVIDNLLSNAIKHSPYGGAIRIRLAQESVWVTLDVIDDGPGIEKEEAVKVFEAFYQGRAAREGHVAGSGLGLSIAREYIVAHKGKIEAVTGTTQGAHLRVRLPTNLSWSEA